MVSANALDFIINTPRGDLHGELILDHDAGSKDLRFHKYQLTLCMDEAVSGLFGMVCLNFEENLTGIFFSGYGACYLSTLGPDIKIVCSENELARFQEQMKFFGQFLVTSKLLKDARLKYLEWELSRLQFMIEREGDYLRAAMQREIDNIKTYLDAVKAGERD